MGGSWNLNVCLIKVPTYLLYQIYLKKINTQTVLVTINVENFLKKILLKNHPMFNLEKALGRE